MTIPMIRVLALSLLLPLFLAVSGCGILSSSSTGDQSNKVTIEVNSAPPADKVEKADARPTSPGFGYIWVNGYWDYLDGNYVWRSGRWTQSRPDYEYVRARYEFDGKAWLFHRPHWKRRHAATPAPTATTPAATTPASDAPAATTP